MATKTKARPPACLTLLQHALGAGFDSLAALAQAARVSLSVVYQANLGQPPSGETIDLLVEALNGAPRPAKVSADDVLDAIALGAQKKIDKMRRKAR